MSIEEKQQALIEAQQKVIESQERMIANLKATVGIWQTVVAQKDPEFMVKFNERMGNV